MSEKIPTVGRSVHINLKNKNGEMVVRPATVVRRWGDTPESAINLQVLTDGTNDFDTGTPGANGLLWVTSAMKQPEGPALDRHWFWPPMV